MKHQIAIAVGKTGFQRGLGKQPRAPGGVFLRRSGVRRIERCPLRKRVRGRNAIVRSQTATPVEGLQFAALVDSEGIGGVVAIEAEGRCGLGHSGAEREHHQQECCKWDGGEAYSQSSFVWRCYAIGYRCLTCAGWGGDVSALALPLRVKMQGWFDHSASSGLVEKIHRPTSRYTITSAACCERFVVDGEADAVWRRSFVPFVTGSGAPGGLAGIVHANCRGFAFAESACQQYKNRHNSGMRRAIRYQLGPDEMLELLLRFAGDLRELDGDAEAGATAGYDTLEG